MSGKLSDCLTVPKAYWKIFNRFLNNIKISFQYHHYLLTEKSFQFFQEKQNFAKNSLPINVPLKISFSGDDITQTIKKLNPDKSHVWGNISISMIKICDKSAINFSGLVSRRNFSRLLEKSQYSSSSLKRKQKSTEKLQADQRCIFRYFASFR